MEPILSSQGKVIAKISWNSVALKVLLREDIQEPCRSSLSFPLDREFGVALLPVGQGVAHR